MFWGLIMEPQRRYTQKVKKAFHISMAALDVSTSSTEPAQVMCGFEGRNYLLCTLQKPGLLQCPLNLNFEVGSEVSFAANGKCHIHLTGYLNEDFGDLEEEGEEEEEEDQAESEEVLPKAKKRPNKAKENGPPNKKTKNGAVSSSQKEVVDEDEDSDDSDYLENLLGKSLEDEEDDSDASIDEGEEDEEEENSDEAEEEENEDEEDESSLSEEEAESSPKPKMNGVVTPKKPKTPVEKNKEKQEEQQQKKTPKKEGKTPKKEGKTPSKEAQSPKKKSLQGGVIVEDIKEGNGAPAKVGKFVNVYYEGRLKQNNKMFDSTTKGAGFSFRLGNGEVIKGWDIGISGMKIGGKRRITCPPHMAYGQKGSPPAIPPNATLVFEVELRKVN